MCHLSATDPALATVWYFGVLSTVQDRRDVVLCEEHSRTSLLLGIAKQRTADQDITFFWSSYTARTIARLDLTWHLTLVRTLFHALHHVYGTACSPSKVREVGTATRIVQNPGIAAQNTPEFVPFCAAIPRICASPTDEILPFLCVIMGRCELHAQYCFYNLFANFLPAVK